VAYYPERGRKNVRSSLGHLSELILCLYHLFLLTRSTQEQLAPDHSKYDPNPADHMTVRLSNPSLRTEGSYNVLHFRPRSGGGSVVLDRIEDLLLEDQEGVHFTSLPHTLLHA
jgi:hypothetical protein